MWNVKGPEPKWNRKISKKELDNSLGVPLLEYNAVLSTDLKNRSDKKALSTDLKNRSEIIVWNNELNKSEKRLI